MKNLDKIKNLLYVTKRIYKIAPLRLIFILLLALSDGVNIFITTFFFKFIIDAIISKQPFTHIILIIATRIIYFLIYLLVDNILHQIVFPKMERKIKCNLSTELFDAIADLDLSWFDDPKTYDKVTRAINEGENRIGWLLSSIRGLASTSVQTIVLVISLATISPISIIIALVGVIVTFWGNSANTKTLYLYDKAETRPKRTMDYIKRIYNTPSSRKDLHVSNLNALLKEKYAKQLSLLDNLTDQYAPKIATVNVLCSWGFNFVNIAVSSVVVAWRIYNGYMSVGDFASVINAIALLSDNFLRYSSIIPELGSHGLFFNDYMEIFSMKSCNKEKPYNLPAEAIESVDVNNVSFKYQGTDMIIKDVSFSVKKGQKIALVGENGAGKTTLVKLIQGLYLPTLGTISYNGIKSSQLRLKDLNKRIAYVDQDYQVYAVSLDENIRLLDRNLVKTSEDSLSALENVGLVNLKNILGNEVTKELSEDGQEFSGGQKQRIAIARALCADFDILILDEPSSALDPVSEEAIYEKINSVFCDKIIIIVSHRLTCMKQMNQIYYLEKGEIVEQGTHDELMEINGKYATIFKVQKNRYV